MTNDQMKIEVLEPTGIRHEPYGHMQCGEVRFVARKHGLFFCANGWAKDLGGEVETGERGLLDTHDPEEWSPGDPPKPGAMIVPHDSVHE